MKFALLTVLLILGFVCSAVAQGASVSAGDLKTLEGREWSGTLTYLDYSSNKKTSIKSNLKVTAAAEDKMAWRFEYIYPDEPKANGKSDVKLSTDGLTFNEQTVIERIKLADGTTKIVTTKDGPDNGKKALFRHTYLVSAKSFSIMKEVRTEGSADFFERNTYTWTR